jgi:hypothetical protein
MSELLKSTGFTNEMKLELFTNGKNSLVMRIENIADIFDSNDEIIYVQIHHKDLATGLYTLANGDGSSCTFVMTEMSLTNN